MDARRLDWSDLEIFLATARGGSLAAAAGTLGLDASTAHRRIGKLESALHTRLFDRSQRGYSLTSAGEELLAHTEAMDEQVVAARRKVVARDDALSGVVRVATVDGLMLEVLPPIFASFREAHPNVTVVADLNVNLIDLAREPADVAIRLGMKPPTGDLIAKPVCKVRLATYASPAYLKKHGTPRRLEDLRSHATVRGILVAGSSPFEQFMHRHGDPAKIAFCAHSFVARQAAIRAGMGVGLLGRFMGDPDKALRRLPLPEPDVTATLTMLVHVDVHRNARVRAFVKHTHAALLAQRALFEGRL